MAVKDTTVIAGQGWAYYADPDTAPFSLANYKGEDPTANIETWTWMGSTSKNNLTTIDREGGDITTLGSWDTPALRNNESDVNWTITLNSLSITPETLGLAFPGGKWNAESKTYDIPAKTTTNTKALLVLIKDAVQGIVGLYFPKGTISLAGSPTLSVDNFLEVPLRMNALTSGKTGNVMSWILPASLAAGAGTTTSTTMEGA